MTIMRTFIVIWVIRMFHFNTCESMNVKSKISGVVSVKIFKSGSLTTPISERIWDKCYCKITSIQKGAQNEEGEENKEKKKTDSNRGLKVQAQKY